MSDLYLHKCKDNIECWEWWVDLWRRNNQVYPDYNELVANELWDYHGLISGLPFLYDDITGGRVSKPNTSKSVVAELVQERVNEAYDEGYREGQRDCDTDS